MSILLKRFTSNATANIVGGLGTAIYNLVLPSLVVHKLSPEYFSVWSLGIQVMIYVQVLGFGIQTAIARFIAADNEYEDKSNLYLTTAVGKSLVRTMMGIGFVGSILLMYIYPLFFSKLTPENIIVLRYCVLCFGVSASIQLLALLPIGFFTGVHENYIHVASQFSGRIVSLLVICFLVNVDASIQILAVGLSLGLLIPVILLTIFLRKRMQYQVLNKYTEIEYNKRKSELISYCKVLAVWSICMLFVNAFQPFVAGYFDVKYVGPYTLAFTLTMVMVGLQQAVMAPLLTLGASLWAKKRINDIYDLYRLSTVICCAILSFSIVFFFYFGESIIKYWIGDVYVRQVYVILILLVLSNAIRNIMSPYSLLLVSVGAHKKSYKPAIIEAISIVCFCSLLGYYYGISGVALGSILSSIIAVNFTAILTFKYSPFIKSNKLLVYFKYVLFPIFAILFLYFFMASLNSQHILVG